MDFSIFAYVAILILVALFSTRLMRIIKLPNVIGYIVTGIIMGPFVFVFFLIVMSIAAVYIVFRVIGKWSGAFTGASITRCEPQVNKYIGFALVPQAGVAIGLSTTAYNLFSNNPSIECQRAGALILAIILTSTLVYELIGPMVAKFALSKANEIPERFSK